MKSIFLLLILFNLSYAQYNISFNKIKLGEIKNIDNIKHNYIKIDVTNFIAKLLLRHKILVYYNSSYTIERKNKNIKFKEDKYEIINILKMTMEGDIKNKRIKLKKNKHIDIKKDGDKYSFIYYNSKNIIKSKGTIYIKNGKLISLIDEKNHIEIISTK